jgi:hypothetical protein
MPHGTRTAMMLAVVVASTAAAAIPARGQIADRPGVTWDLTRDLLRPDRTIQPPRFPEPGWTPSPPPPAPWGAVTAPGAKPAPGGMMTELQARNSAAAAGYTNISRLEPGYLNWTGYASKFGRVFWITIDPQGNVFTN